MLFFVLFLEPINIFHGVEQNDYEPIRLSYQRGSHYNSIVDPCKPSIGCGLGLPSFTHGGADSKLIKEALRKREDFHIEQVKAMQCGMILYFLCFNYF